MTRKKTYIFRGCLALSICLAYLATISVCLAQDTDGSGWITEAEGPIISINFTIVVVVVSFIIFMFMMQLYVINPVIKLLDKRKKHIEDSASKATDLTNRAGQLEQECKSTLLEARLERADAIHRLREQGAQEKARAIQTQHEKNTRQLAEQHEQLGNTVNTERRALDPQTEELARLIINRILEDYNVQAK